MRQVKTAMFSVYDKRGIVACAQQLHEMGIQLVSSGGTAQELRDHNLPVIDVSQLVGHSMHKQLTEIFRRFDILEDIMLRVDPVLFQETLECLGKPILDHRVVTLVPQVHAGLLAQLELPKHLTELEELGVPPIDILFLDTYPLKRTAADPSAAFADIVKMTDIGGPAMLRSAAKGNRLVVCDPADRQPTINAIRNGEDLDALAKALGDKAEAVVADYCLTSARGRSGGLYDGVIGRRYLTSKYGENPWQIPSGVYTLDSGDPLGGDRFELVEGTMPGYVGNADRERLLQTITHIAAGFDVNHFSVPRIAIAVKHGNACGAGVDEEPMSALQKMIEGDTLSIFGAVVMTNFAVDEELSNSLLHYALRTGEERRMLAGVIAPAFTSGAIEMLARKKGKCQLMVNPALAKLDRSSLDTAPRISYIRGGFQMQPNYTFVFKLHDNPKLQVTGSTDTIQNQDITLAWAIGSTSTSNTVTLVQNRKLIGNGVGQQDRVFACQIAVMRAQRSGHNPAGSVSYSDSFFPQIDGPAVLAEAGVAAIFASSGSIKDEAVRAFCVERGVTLYMMPDPDCRGFFAHC